MALALETVVKQLADSGIIAPGKLENFVPPKASPKDAEELLRELFKQNLLTKFQAQQFAAGRAKSLILGGYIILDKIGAGGMGQVFKAHHRRMERVVAIKMLPNALMKDAAAVARFQREVVAAAKLRHTNIVAADDAAEANGVHFLVMEYVDGQDLSALVKKNGPFSVEKAVDYILQAAKGLEFAHKRGVIHRDIKPANLLLDSEGTVKILDMGLARIEAGGNAATQAELTGTGAIMGTVDYMAPEQALDTRHADARADIYSLGCSLYYLLAGGPVYGGETVTAKLLAHQGNPIPTLRALRDDVPEVVDAILEKMLAKKPDERYQTMTEVIADLQPLASSQLPSPLADFGELSRAGVRGSGVGDTSNNNLTFLRDATHHTRKTKAAPPGKVASRGFKNKKLVVIGAGAAAFLCLLLGIWVIVRDKDGNEVGRVKVPDGGTATIQVNGGSNPGVLTRIGNAPPIAKAPFDAAQARTHQEAWAKHLGTEVETTNSVGMKMVLIPPGEFMMGSTDEQVEAALKVAKGDVAAGYIQKSERPQHRIMITKPFRMGATEVTVGQMKKFTTATRTYLNPGYDVTDNSPASLITWKDAVAYCDWLSDQEQVTYRLPTEAEWEYACRAGTTTQYSFGDDHEQLEQYGWFKTNGGDKSHPVGTKRPNGFGLFDMHGQLYEWCGDYFDEKWYSTSPPNDPNGPSAGISRVVRGGSWNSNASRCRSASRNNHTASDPNPNHGFRIVRELTAPSTTASVEPPPVAALAKPITDFNSPEFQAWMKEVQAMPVDEQVKAVQKKLGELNPGLDPKNRPGREIKDGAVIEWRFSSANQLVDLSPVRALSQLKSLVLSTCPELEDLSPLEGMSLTSLHLHANKVKNFSPLKGMPLTALTVSFTPVTDLSPLGGMRLQQLNIHACNAKDLSVLQGMPLTELHIGALGVKDLASLRGLPLQKLTFSGGLFSDLTPLKDMPLIEFHCLNTRVTDLTPLYSCRDLRLVTFKANKFTAAAITSLQKALPNCKIEWDDPAKATTPAAPVGPTPPLAKAPFDAAQAKAHQEAWAKHLGTEVETTNSVGMKMVLIPPGEFLMGSTDEQVEAALKVAEEIKAEHTTKDRILKAERPQNKVVITKPFLTSATEITVGQFKKFSATGHITVAEKAARTDPKVQTYLNPGYAVSDESPAAVITWNDAVAYCQWLSSQEKRTYRLPTEAEWEYACRAGTTTQYNFGDDYHELPKYAWQKKNAGSQTHPVGALLPNPFGLLDMHGNLFEWCGDFYDEKWYGKSSANDPIGPTTGLNRMLRGGHWNATASICRSAYRYHDHPTNRNNDHGFRYVSELEVPVTVSATPAPSTVKLFMHDPAFPQWVKDVQAMPAQEQVKAVSKKLMELNPGFDGTLTGLYWEGTPSIKNGVVTLVGLRVDSISDLSPLRAFTGLNVLGCLGTSPEKSKLSNLSPLSGIPLVSLHCLKTPVVDLAPLKDMPLKTLSVDNTLILDLSPLKGMELTSLECASTQVSDLSPLSDCKSLQTLNIKGTKVNSATVAALQVALPNCKIEWDDPAKATPK